MDILDSYLSDVHANTVVPLMQKAKLAQVVASMPPTELRELQSMMEGKTKEAFIGSLLKAIKHTGKGFKQIGGAARAIGRVGKAQSIAKAVKAGEGVLKPTGPLNPMIARAYEGSAPSMGKYELLKKILSHRGRQISKSYQGAGGGLSGAAKALEENPLLAAGVTTGVGAAGLHRYFKNKKRRNQVAYV